MQKLTVYRVTKDSSDGTFIKGDLIWLSENEDLNSVEGKGWLTKDEWSNQKTKDFMYEEAKEYKVIKENGREYVKKVKGE